MANNISVSWMQVTNFSLGSGGIGLSSATYKNLYSSSSSGGKSILDFGAVQAGKITNIKCVVARFKEATTVSDLQFWLDSTKAQAAGSQNKDLSGSGWEFYYCIVPKDKLDFNIETDVMTEEQKKGGEYLGEKNSFKMIKIPRTVEEVSYNQFTNDGVNPLSINITQGGYGDSHLIFLDVQTSSDAYSGNTEGWYYRMNFLYS